MHLQVSDFGLSRTISDDGIIATRTFGTVTHMVRPVWIQGLKTTASRKLMSLSVGLILRIRVHVPPRPVWLVLPLLDIRVQCWHSRSGMCWWSCVLGQLAPLNAGCALDDCCMCWSVYSSYYTQMNACCPRCGCAGARAADAWPHEQGG